MATLIDGDIEIPICDGCHRPFADGEVPVDAVEVIPTPVMGDPTGTADGLAGLFHSRCFALAGARWRRTTGAS